MLEKAEWDEEAAGRTEKVRRRMRILAQVWKRVGERPQLTRMTEGGRLREAEEAQEDEDGWSRLEKAEEDEAEGRARGREAAAAAPAGPAGRVAAARAGLGGAAGPVPAPSRFGSRVYPRAGGGETGGGTGALTPSGHGIRGTTGIHRHQDGRGCGGGRTPKCGSLCFPPPSAPPPGGREPPSVPRECPQPCPHRVPTPGSPSLSPQL